ncbi:macrolide family glycosyltransferase [Pseudonocardia zijingensis]|uniref:Glycosyltransferase n=1 Tax=Pseudonocardia zijingensis TaxID=153376 RepID=A0ABN1PSX2_9PSEU
MSHVVMTGMPAAGHVNPSLPFVRELVRRGVCVTYYCADAFGDAIAQTGAEFRPYPAGSITAADIAEATSAGSPVRVVVRALAATETLVPHLQHELRSDPPDALAHDSNAIWGHVVARSMGLPTVSFMTTMLVGAGAFRSQTAREWLRFLAVAVRDVPAAVAARQRVVRTFGKELFPPRPAFPTLGDVTVFPIPRWLQAPDPRIDERCHYVGATIDPAGRDRELDAELAAHVDGPDPVVLVSLGTLHAGSDAFFRSCFDAFAGLPARVVIATGPRGDPARLGPPPANTLVRASVPQPAVLGRTAVFVTHGGMNSALEGLAAGVPLVVLPQQIEQLLIGRAVADRGAAVVLRHHLSGRPVPTAELRAAVEATLADPSRRSAAEALGATVGEGGGAGAGGDAVQRLLARRPVERG